jgi:hypothetical protein
VTRTTICSCLVSYSGQPTMMRWHHGRPGWAGTETLCVLLFFDFSNVIGRGTGQSTTLLGPVVLADESPHVKCVRGTTCERLQRQAWHSTLPGGESTLLLRCRLRCLARHRGYICCQCDCRVSAGSKIIIKNQIKESMTVGSIPV